VFHVLRLTLLAIFFLRNHFFAIIKAAVGADGVREVFFATIGASYNRAGRQRIMRAAAVSAAFRMFAFRMWGHGVLFLI